MKIIFMLLLIFCTISANDNVESDDKLKKILNNFSSACQKIDQIEYLVQRIDTFRSGHVWDKNGYAIIKKVKNDSKYGFYFFGENYSANHISLYDGENYTIDKTKKEYDNSRSLKGSPGEQMVSTITELIFSPSSDFKDVLLIDETNYSYKIKYIYEDDTSYNVEDIEKIIELDKETFLPLKISKTSYRLGNLSAHHFIISDLKINSDVTSSIEKVKSILKEYSPKEEKIKKAKTIINTIVPDFKLPKLLAPSLMVGIREDKVTLIDFWEVWCGPCITSLPKVEKIFQKYSDKVDVIGFVSEDLENAKKMLSIKGITFESLIATKNILESFRVNSFPRYFLIDRNGKVVKEYHGFSNDIENDIITLLDED